VINQTPPADIQRPRDIRINALPKQVWTGRIFGQKIGRFQHVHILKFYNSRMEIPRLSGKVSWLHLTIIPDLMLE